MVPAYGDLGGHRTRSPECREGDSEVRIRVDGSKSRDVHRQVVEFITQNLLAWGGRVKGMRNEKGGMGKGP